MEREMGAGGQQRYILCIGVSMDYISLFPPAAREKTRLMGLAGAVMRQVGEMQEVIASMEAGFSVVSAVGVQLDMIGESFGIPRSGGQTDTEYREYLRERLKLYRWNGMNEDAENVTPEGVRLNDNGDGSVTVTPAGVAAPVPAGVGRR